MQLNDSVVLVTGANGGLGREFVDQALRRGARKVYAAARRPQKWTDERVEPLQLDVTDAASIASALAVAEDTTVLINNAGITGADSLVTSDLTSIRETFETNVFGPVQLVRGLAPSLADAGGGAVVNVLSALSWLATPGAYSPSKAAFWGVTNSMRLELAAQGTQVVAAHLGFTDTPMIEHLDVAKGDAGDVVAAILDGLESGADEVLADDTSRAIKAGLSTSTTGGIAFRV